MSSSRALDLAMESVIGIVRQRDEARNATRSALAIIDAQPTGDAAMAAVRAVLAAASFLPHPQQTEETNQ